MNRPRLIAFTGLAQAGKTTAAELLLKGGYVRVSFATPIKEMVACLTDETDKEARPPELCGKSLRETYQNLGTEWGRQMIGEDVWAMIGSSRIRMLLGTPIRGVVVDDLRFNNEAKVVRDLGGIVLGVSRKGTVQMAHASEAGVDPQYINAIVRNDGSVEDLHAQISSVFQP